MENQYDWLKIRIIEELFKEEKFSITGNALKLLRRHDKKLSQIGDYSCPLDYQIWQRVLQVQCKKNIEENIAAISIIKRIETLSNGHVNIFLDRSKVLPLIFKNLDCFEAKNGLKPRFPSSFKPGASITEIRRIQAEEFAMRIKQDHTIPHQIGPVLDKDTKKKCQTSFLQTYDKFYRVADQASRERQVHLTESQRKAQVHILASAELQFQLLGPNFNQPVILDASAYSNATFVIYNYARMTHLLTHEGTEGNFQIGKIVHQTFLNYQFF